MFLLFDCFVFNHQKQTKHPSFTNQAVYFKTEGWRAYFHPGESSKGDQYPLSPHPAERRRKGSTLEVGTTTLDLCQGSVILDLLLGHIYMFYTITYWSLAGSHKLNEQHVGN